LRQALGKTETRVVEVNNMIAADRKVISNLPLAKATSPVNAKLIASVKILRACGWKSC